MTQQGNNMFDWMLNQHFPSSAELAAMTDEDLIREYDKRIPNQILPDHEIARFVNDELARRRNERIANKTLKATQLAVVIALIAVAVSIVALLLQPGCR